MGFTMVDIPRFSIYRLDIYSLQRYLIFQHKIYKLDLEESDEKCLRSYWNLWCLIAHNFLILKILNLRFSSPIWVILCLPYLNMNALYLILHSSPSYSSQRDVFLPVLNTTERGLCQKGLDQIHAALNFTKSSNLSSCIIVLDHLVDNKINLSRILTLILE